MRSRLLILVLLQISGTSQGQVFPLGAATSNIHDELHALGGYETWPGTSRVEVQASDKIEREILGLLAEVNAKP